jgi:hypothetical protein
MSPDQQEERLAAEAQHAAERVALYRQRLYAGNGNPRRLLELERIERDAAERLTRHRAAAGTAAQDAALRTTLTVELDDVNRRLDAPDLPASKRIALLQRQAELGDLRDELALRNRRRTAPSPPRRS